MKCIPEVTECRIEPFAGSASISVAAAWRGRAHRFWLNDAHCALISLWQRIIHDPDGLSQDYRHIWEAQHGRDRKHYNEIRAEFNRTHKPELLLFLLARCVKAAIRYNRKGEFNNSPDHRRSGMRPDTMARNIHLVSEALGQDTRTTSYDYTVVLKEATTDDLVYMDPPYQGVCKDRDSRYVKAVQFDEFVEELDSLNQRSVPFVVSYDGRTGDKSYGKMLPNELNLQHAELLVGRSTQATLLGRNDDTYESLYVSEAAVERLGGMPRGIVVAREKTQTLFD
ncbi:MAG: DNA adenine methylase [Planctomycetes bacterium]|nr:DNA adenine methylase [Planctomycetota bacterium]